MKFSRNQGVLFSTDGTGAVCQYCRRVLEPTSSKSELAAVREHIKPRHQGGRARVWSCHKCDVMKGNKSETEWKAFMQKYPQWWTWKILKCEFETQGKEYCRARYEYKRRM